MESLIRDVRVCAASKRDVRHGKVVCTVLDGSV